MGFGGIFDLEFMNLSLLINLIEVNLELEFYYFLFDLKGWIESNVIYFKLKDRLFKKLIKGEDLVENFIK